MLCIEVAGTHFLRDFDPERAGSLSFEQFFHVVQAGAAPPRAPGSPTAADGKPGSRKSGSAGSELATSPRAALLADEAADPKVDEFLRVMDEYRAKCESEGLYEEAMRATEQLDSIRKQEEARRIKAIRTRHSTERREVGDAHNAQYAEFNSAWDKYLAEFDSMAAMYVAQMQERHGARMKEFQETLHADLLRRPVKFSRELLEWRSREAQLAKQRKYADAQRIKLLADDLERRERAKLEEERLALFAQRDAKFAAQQAAELAALVKRIETRRAEHLKQREVDSKRLLQRNRNVMGVLESRQVMEEQKFTAEVKMHLHPLKYSPLGKTGRPALTSGGSATSPRAGFSVDAYSPMTASSGARAGGGSPHAAGSRTTTAAGSRGTATVTSPMRASVQARIAAAASAGSPSRRR